METLLKSERRFTLGCAGALLALLALPCAGSDGSAVPAATLKFTSAGHAVGFSANGYSAAAASHALRVQFLGASEVAPVSSTEPGRGGTLAPLGRVSYPCLWDGITATYDAPAGAILRSTFTLEPGADPTAIGFRYDAPLAIAPDGALAASYERGVIRESAPIAWQVIGGRRVGVPVAFELRGACEAGFAVGAYDPALPLTIDPVTSWNTFHGGPGDDVGNAIHVAEDGTIVILGNCDGPWGTPILPYSDTYDIAVVKLDASGNLLWNTFLGGDFDDYGNGLAVDSDGSIYIAGLTEGPWNAGPPPVAGYVDVDGYVAKLGPSGNLIWRTFTGGTGAETCTAIAIAPSGTLAVTGFSDESWGGPLHGHAGGADDGFVLMLNASGGRLWSTFLGSGGADTAESVAVDDIGNIYVAGTSDAAWGPAIRAFTALTDGFVARYDSLGTLTWNTFLGGSGNDRAASIALDASGDLLVAGASSATWHTPVQGFTASIGDGYAAKLDAGGGTLLWNTFLGGTGDDSCESIVGDAFGDIFVMGTSTAQWGAPAQGYAGGANDAYVARLDAIGALAIHTFLGSSQGDQAGAIALDSASSVLALGRSSESWGTPIDPYHPNPGNNYDIFVAMVDIASPTASSFDLFAPATSPTNADALVFAAVFSEVVLGVDAADFMATGTTAMVTGVAELAPGEYTVTVAGGDLAGLNGVAGLDFAVAASIADVAGNDFLGGEPLVDEVFTVDNIAPDATIDLPTPADPTGSADATFFFSSADPTAAFESDLDGGGFALATSPQDWFGLGTGLHIFTLHAIDEAGNVGNASFSWTIDLVAPMVDSIVRADPNPTSEPIVDFTVLFSEPVTGVGMANFALVTTGLTGTAITGVTGGADSYTVTVTTGMGVGTIRLDLAGIGALADAVGNPLAGTFTTGEFYTIVPPEPQFIRGDANTDFAVNIADPIFVLAHLFTQGLAPGCRDTADANDDGLLNIADAVNLLDHLFSGGPPPPAPFGTCGVDPTADALDCASYVFCQP